MLSNYHANDSLLDGKVIMVTGAGDGIGKTAAITYARHGATVILLGKTAEKLSATYDEIEAIGGPQPAIIPLDLKGANLQNYQDMAQSIEAEFGKLDGVLFSAGILGVLSPFEQIEEKVWDEVMQVNLKSQFLMTQALMPVLMQADRASIIFTSSGVGKKGRAFWGSYAISKFATEGMMQVLADECENTPVRVNCINPGATRTSMRAQAYPAEDPSELKTPEDIMDYYLYLMGDDSLEHSGKSFDAQKPRN